MKKNGIALLLATAMMVGLVGCGAQENKTTTEPQSVAESTPEQIEAESSPDSTGTASQTTFRIAGLKGPTTMGLVNLMAKAEAGEMNQDYQFTMYGAADEVVPLLVKGEIDVAAIPANLAATLYQKTNGAIEAVAVNTLGVLYAVESGDTVHSVADLAGRTILTTGKGTTPEYVLRYLLSENELDPDADVTIEFFSEATEVGAQLATRPDAVAILPQPYVAAMMASAAKDQSVPLVHVALDLTEEWNKVSDGNLITGVTVVNKAFAEANTDALQTFLMDYKGSVNAANSDVENTAALCEKYGIVAKAAIAQNALPECNIVFLTGDELKTGLSQYLQVLYDADPASIGGNMPGDDFYYSVG